ncbi:TIR domain-containing protein [uncultured Sphingomonas sp.]|uniref:TIR domain-containing protein n=1 Tax=uncultured Sphingomonas sp. TaxID=158754 RepID=UPI0025867065|nr:TIR domain-containing protein [uncultured Sphingomonas sp.]
MAYRNGTYIAFHADGQKNPTASDIKYYRTIKMWHENDGINFNFVNSHEKVAAVRDTSQAATIKRSLRERLDNSKNFLLIIGQTTKNDTDFVPYEIQYAADTCELPFILVYTRWKGILQPSIHKDEWPTALARRLEAGTINAIHLPFKRGLIDDAIGRYNLKTQPDGQMVHYTKAFQEQHGVVF